MGTELKERMNGQGILTAEINRLENSLYHAYAMLLDRSHGQALFERAIEVLGNEQNAMRWFRSKVKGLGYNTPLECIKTVRGRQDVEAMLDRIGDGVIY
jgi:Antitoxin Xre/MbcA/ParS C-terminal toxin-binding domain